MFQILLAGNNKNETISMKSFLISSGYEAGIAFIGKNLSEKLFSHHYDLVLLLFTGGDTDSFPTVRQVRAFNNSLPVMIISDKNDSSDVISAFEAGTDDYIQSPFNEKELLLRIKAVLRRSNSASDRILRVGNIMLDYDSFTVSKEGNTVSLPQKQFYLLFKLLSNPNKVYNRIQLMDEIWGIESSSVDTTVNVHINRLRNHFKDWKEFEIVAIRGVGYKAVINE